MAKLVGARPAEVEACMYVADRSNLAIERQLHRGRPLLLIYSSTELTNIQRPTVLVVSLGFHCILMVTGLAPQQLAFLDQSQPTAAILVAHVGWPNELAHGLIPSFCCSGLFPQPHDGA